MEIQTFKGSSEQFGKFSERQKSDVPYLLNEKAVQQLVPIFL